MQMRSSQCVDLPVWYPEQVAQAPLDWGFPLPLSTLSVRASGPVVSSSSGFPHRRSAEGLLVPAVHCVGSESWRLVEMVAGRVSTYSSHSKHLETPGWVLNPGMCVLTFYYISQGWKSEQPCFGTIFPFFLQASWPTSRRYNSVRRWCSLALFFRVRGEVRVLIALRDGVLPVRGRALH